MEHYEREFFVSRIDAGYFKYRCDDVILHLQSPSREVMYDAHEIYRDTFRHASFAGAPAFVDIIDILSTEGFWTEQMESDFKVLPKNIDKLKVELYNAVYKSNLRQKIREYLRVSKGEFDRLNEVQHEFDYLTCEGIASFSRWQFIVENSVTYQDGTPYKWDTHSLSEVMGFYQDAGLDEEMIRELARTDPWSSLWAVRKKNGLIFPSPMTWEQRAIVMWSNMYDNIHESADCPHDNILADNDMLDGWLILQRQNREKEQMKKRGEETVLNPKIAAAQEVFIPADTMEDAELIASMNETYGSVVRRSRLNKVQKEKEVKFGDFGDVRRRIQSEAIAKNRDTMKGK